ncbi:MAG: PIG-L family deacetylase [Myxococcota bacterium]
MMSLMFVASVACWPSQPAPRNPATLKSDLLRLGSTLRVLYVAAHPDDENTRFLSYLTRGIHADAAYLSLTRGGGGQNRIGDEQGGMLSLVRTEELLAARGVDGARQFFTRARDFGYSKSAEETLEIWDEELVVADAVEVIRSFRPDVIVTRFRPDGPSHGHHLASARVARIAFDKAADPAFSSGRPPWQAKRLVLNVPRWRGRDFEGTPDSEIQVGGYAPLFGMSFPEIAAASRSMHKSQAFGMAPNRGVVTEWFDLVAGADLGDQGLWSDIDGTWSRFEGGDRVDGAIRKAVAGWTFEPSQSIPDLIEVDRSLTRLDPEIPRVREARRALAEMMVASAGLFLRVVSKTRFVVPRQDFELELQAGLPSDRAKAGPEVRVMDARYGEHALESGFPVSSWSTATWNITAPEKGPWSSPFWLQGLPKRGVYTVPSGHSAIAPRSSAVFPVAIDLRLDGHAVQVTRPASFVWVDRTRGERQVDVSFMPPLTATPTSKVVWAVSGEVARVRFEVASEAETFDDVVSLEVPDGWTARPGSVTVSEPQLVEFQIQAPQDAAPAQVFLRRRRDAPVWGRTTVDYPHITPTVVLTPAMVKVSPVKLERRPVRIGYIMGAGDAVPESLRAFGAEVELLSDDDLKNEGYRELDTVVCGVRAFNLRKALVAHRQSLFEWVGSGGRLVVQYNTNNWLDPLSVDVGPYPIRIDSTRVTNENAPVEILAPEHPLTNMPHRIGSEDFEGWVQERGLYFAEEWDDRYRPILAMHDEGEPPAKGSLLIADHGRGQVVVTSLSFFRQLPAGVPGAGRLFMNLVMPPELRAELK